MRIGTRFVDGCLEGMLAGASTVLRAVVAHGTVITGYNTRDFSRNSRFGTAEVRASVARARGCGDSERHEGKKGKEGVLYCRSVKACCSTATFPTSRRGKIGLPVATSWALVVLRMSSSTCAGSYEERMAVAVWQSWFWMSCIFPEAEIMQLIVVTCIRQLTHIKFNIGSAAMPFVNALRNLVYVKRSCLCGYRQQAKCISHDVRAERPQCQHSVLVRFRSLTWLSRLHR